MEYVKPLLAYVTTIDFGHVTYMEEFVQTLANAGFVVLEDVLIKQSGAREQRMIVAGRAEN